VAVLYYTRVKTLTVDLLSFGNRHIDVHVSGGHSILCGELCLHTDN
jgi:hypothetical protein